MSILLALLIKYQLPIYFVVAVLIEQLPSPTSTSSGFYKYFYSVVQILAANFRRSGDAIKSSAQVSKQGE